MLRPQVSGCNQCCDDHGGGSLIAGATLYYIKPVWNANPAFATAPIDADSPITQTDFDYSYTASPAIWVGFGDKDGIGGRARWFRFDQNESLRGVNDGSLFILSATPLGLANASDTAGDDLFFGSALRVETWDAEITNSCSGCNWNILVAGGVRYAHIRQNFRTVEIPLEDEDLFDQVWSGHSFNGIGPTVALEARRSVGGGGLGVYANARGSLLWGDGGQQVREVLNGDLDNIVEVSTNRDKFISNAELEVGGEFSRVRNGGRSRAFVRAGLVAMGYFGVGNSANVGDLGDFPGTLDNNGDLGFFGLALSAGVTY